MADINALLDPAGEYDIPHPDPAYHYRWVNRLLPHRIARFIRGGYGPVTGKEEANRLFGSERGEMLLDANGRVCLHDSILMKCPIDWWAKVQAEKARRNRELLDGPVEQFQAEVDGLSRKGVKAFVTDRESFEDEKAFNTRESNNRVSVPALPGKGK